MCRVMGKYMRIWYGNGECKTCPHPTPLSCISVSSIALLRLICIENLKLVFLTKAKLCKVEMDRIKVRSGFNLSLVVGCTSEGKMG